MRHIQALAVSLVAFGAVGVVAPGSAHAQAVADPASGPRMWVGAQLGLSPIGTLKADVAGTPVSGDAETAFEVGGRFEYQVTPLLSIGIAPSFRFHIKSKDDPDSESQLDVPLRIAAGWDVAPMVRVYGFAAPGYTFLFPPNDPQGNSTSASGFMLGFGGGAAYRLAPKFTLSGELGYQFRFPSGSADGMDVSYQDNFLTLTVGAAAGF
jgi:outer membrane protein with beta-barrel domain